VADVLDVVTDALREIGVLAAGETASAEDALSGLSALNRLIDQWRTEELNCYKTDRSTWTIVSGTQQYTLGIGGTINIARPVYIDHIHFEDQSPAKPIEYQMNPLTDDAWSRIPIHTITAPFPTSWYYNPTFPLGTVELWPVPTSATLKGVIYAPVAVAEFTTLNDAISLPPGYRRMIVKNLAMEMAPSYTRPSSPELQQQAADSKAAVKRSNKRLVDMQIEAAALGGGKGTRYTYNILVGP
jgi:hypothetical protein